MKTQKELTDLLSKKVREIQMENDYSYMEPHTSLMKDLIKELDFLKKDILRTKGKYAPKGAQPSEIDEASAALKKLLSKVK